MDEAADNTDDGLGRVIEHARAFTIDRLKAGDRANALSFALAYVAAEMGLHITGGKEPLGVFKTVFLALAAAADSVPEGAKAEGASNEQVTSTEGPPPAGASIH